MIPIICDKMDLSTVDNIKGLVGVLFSAPHSW